MTGQDFRTLLGLTLREPMQAARVLMALGLPVSARWMALLLAVSLSGVLAWIAGQLAPIPAEMRTPFSDAISLPFTMAGMQFCAVVLAAGLMTVIGRAFGGHGRFEDALLLTVWIEISLLLIQVLQLVAMVILPPLASILGVLAVALFFWLTVQFTKQLHGFSSSVKVLLGLVSTAFLAGFVLSILIAAFGLMPEIPQ